MAITRAQQVKQMLRKGGRSGYRFGGGYQGSDAKTGQGGASKGPSGGGKSSGGGGGSNRDDNRQTYSATQTVKKRPKVKRPTEDKSDFSGVKQIGKRVVSNTAKNLAAREIAKKLGLGAFNLFGLGLPQLLAIGAVGKKAIKDIRDPQITEDVTLGDLELEGLDVSQIRPSPFETMAPRMQVAELTQKQKDFLNSPKVKFSLQEGILSPKQVFEKLPSYEEKGIFGIGGQEPTTPQEFNEYLQSQNLPTMQVKDGGRIGFFTGMREQEQREQAANRREQTSVARTRGRSAPTAQQVADIVNRDPDDRGKPVQNLTQQLIREGKTPKEIRRITGTQNPIQRFAEDYTANTRRFLYNAFPNNPKNELDYLRSLPASQRALLSPALRAKLEELEDAAEFDDYTGFNKKFTFDEFEELRKFQPTEGLNFAEYAAKFKGAPGLLYSGDVGNLEKFVTKRDAEGRPLEYGYRRKTDDDDPIPILPLTQTPKPEDPDEEAQDPFAGGIGYRFFADGGMPKDAPVGGIMDIESGRQMYFLGRLVKKAKRAVSKIVKSPIGKAALLGGALYFGGAGAGAGKGLGSFFGKGSFNPLKALITTGPQRGKIGSSGLGRLLAKFGLATEGSLTGKGMLALGGLGLTALPFLTGQEEEEDQMILDRGPGLNIAQIRRDAILNPGAVYGNAFRLYGNSGGRAAFQKGGDAEPVAKETMPLLKMGGKEMDLRDNGGFVPIGRMERADDVPARLSKNEFVFTADAVRNAGGGDIDKGAEVMYNTMKNLEAGGKVSEETQGLDGARNMFQTAKRLEEVL